MATLVTLVWNMVKPKFKSLRVLSEANSAKQCCRWKGDQLTPVLGFVGHRLFVSFEQCFT